MNLALSVVSVSEHARVSMFASLVCIRFSSNDQLAIRPAIGDPNPFFVLPENSVDRHFCTFLDRKA